MRSRSCTMEDPEPGPVQRNILKQQQVEEEEEEEEVKTGERRAAAAAAAAAAGGPRKGRGRGVGTTDLSKEDLVHLLGVMEGEVQARDDIIGLLRSDRTGAESLEARYGSAVPLRPLLALHRDGNHGNQGNQGNQDVYETPMAELERLEDRQKETYRRMLEQLLLAEKCHRRTVTELDNEKRKHMDFMNKSDDFTCLLEQERERLKRLLEQEKVYQARKDTEQRRRLEKVRAELVKLKSFALMLVDERQLHMEQMDQQSQKVQDLAQALQEKEQRLAAASGAAEEDAQRLLKLEADLERQAARFAQEQEETGAKLTNQEAQGKQLRLKLAGLGRKVEELEESNQTLQRSEEDLQELREKIGKGECGNSSLVAELETLRKRVLEMEGKDEEITKTETQCRELRNKLQDEENHGKELRLEVDKLQKRMVQLDKLEGAFNKSKGQCSQLHSNLEKEKRAVSDLGRELETVKARLKDLEASESKLEKAEMLLRDDLVKVKSFTLLLVEERKNMAERLRQEEQKSDDLSRMFKAEQGKVTEVTEKLIEESKKLLKFKSETEVALTTLANEREELKSKLASEEEKFREANAKMSSMKVRLEESERKRVDVDQNKNQDEDNKVRELTLEIERLKNRLKQLEVVEGDLMKTEDEYDLLEQRFRTEQDKANSLCKMLEDMKGQVARNKAIEKGELVSPEAELRTRCKMEEAKSRELQADVRALKEKIHDMMNKEDQLSQLQVDYSLLQQRFAEEDEKKKSMCQEVDNLSRELEATKCYGRAVRPSTSGRRMVDVPVTSTAVQTDAVAWDPAEDDTTAGFIRKSVLEENHLMSNLRQRVLRKPAVLERYPPALADLGARRSLAPPWMKKKEALGSRINGSLLPSQMSMSQKPGQPLHIRVTPDPGTSTATLEITSPRAEDFFSSTTIIPTLGLQKPRITIVPKTTTTVTSRSKACDDPGRPDRAKSPVTITAISRAKSPERTGGSGTGGPQSPVSIITVSATPVAEACASPEPHEMTSSRTVIKMTPEKQPVRKYNGNSNIITTEDNKIHIHLGPHFKRPSDGGGGGGGGGSGPAMTPRPEPSTGTVLRSPRQTASTKTTHSKMTSSIMITPVTSAASRPTQSVPGSDVPSARGAATRIPVSKGLKPGGKAVLGVSTLTRLESRADGQSMKIEVRKSTVCGISASGGKN